MFSLELSLIFSPFLLLMLRDRYLFLRKQMSGTYSDWLIDIASKHFRTFKISFMSPSKSCAKRSKECFAMHLQVWLWLSLCICSSRMEGRPESHAHSWKWKLRTERVGDVPVQGTRLIQSSSCSRAHHKGDVKKWSEQAEPYGMAAGSSARLHPGRYWAQGPCREHTLHRGSTSPASLHLKGLCTTYINGENSHACTPKPGEVQENSYMSSTV